MILDVRGLCKDYGEGPLKVEALKDVSFQMTKGETLAIIGTSGSGKTTLLSLLAGLDGPSAGKITFADQEITGMNEKEITAFRGENLGIVFQKFHLMPSLSALENVGLPLEIRGESNIRKRAQRALAEVGLENRLKHRPDQLSGGECQRVAIARALVGAPKILLADEPSGNLDTETGETVMALLFELVRETAMTMILVTHNSEHAQLCQRSIRLHAGKVL